MGDRSVQGDATRVIVAELELYITARIHAASGGADHRLRSQLDDLGAGTGCSRLGEKAGQYLATVDGQLGTCFCHDLKPASGLRAVEWVLVQVDDVVNHAMLGISKLEIERHCSHFRHGGEIASVTHRTL